MTSCIKSPRHSEVHREHRRSRSSLQRRHRRARGNLTREFCRFSRTDFAGNRKWRAHRESVRPAVRPSTALVLLGQNGGRPCPDRGRQHNRAAGKRQSAPDERCLSTAASGITLDIRCPLYVCLKHDYAPQLAFALLLPPAESILITLLVFVSAGRGRDPQSAWGASC